MPDGTGGNGFKDLIPFILFIAMALLGGTANYLAKIKKQSAKFTYLGLIIEWVISAFAGIVVAFLCIELNYSMYVTAAATGIAGHMGGRAVFLLEQLFTKRVGKVG